MGAASIVEMYTQLFAWLMYGRIWDVLNDTGLAYLPFIVLLILGLRDHKRRGDPLSVRALVAGLRVELLLALVVLVLFVIPVVPLHSGAVSSTRVQLECGANALPRVTPADDVSTYAQTGAFAVLDGAPVYAPVGWAFWQSLSQAVTAAAVAGIPCSGDLRGFQLRVSEQTITEPSVRRELSDFVRDCYAASVALLQRDNPLAPHYPPLASASEFGWMGDPALLAHPLYQQRIGNPRADWPFDPARDDGYDAQGGGHPTCQQWWSGVPGINAGLRSRLLAQVDSGVLAQAQSRSAGIRSLFGAGASDEQIEDDVLRALVQVSDRTPLDEGGGAHLTNDYAYNDSLETTWMGRVFSGMAVALGGATTSMAHFPKMMMVREALPIAKAMIAMALVMLLPFILVLSGYSLAVVATAAVAMLGIAAFDLLWGVAYWMDNMLVRSLHTSAGSYLGWLSHPQTTMAMTLVTSVLSILLPLLWFAMLGWIGVKTFTVVSDMASSLTVPAGQVGSTGGTALGSTVTRGLGRK